MKLIKRLIILSFAIFLIEPYSYAALLPPKKPEIKKEAPSPKTKEVKKETENTPPAVQEIIPSGMVLLMTDFGLRDGAVASMKGVLTAVNSNLKIFDITHDIPAYNIWEAAYRLYQTAPYWVPGTVFVSIVDPNVGGKETLIVAQSKNGQYFISPNNGTLTMINDTLGITAIRTIDIPTNRLQNSEQSNTFYGRDVYALIAARLASGLIKFDQVGEELPLDKLVLLPYTKASFNKNVINGIVAVLDDKYGNVWTNIPLKLFNNFHPKLGDKFRVKITNKDNIVYEGILPYYNTFSDVKVGEGLIYFNSLLEISLGLNMANFANINGISSGLDWQIEISPNN